MNATSDLYTPALLRHNHAGGLPSARAVAPLLLKELPHVQSVIDVGCGLGTWAAQFLGLITGDVHGIDGPWVPREALVIPSASFVSLDLQTQGFGVSREHYYDLALCLEVGEHLPASSAFPLVSLLCLLAPIVFFSAAVPGQGGTGHLNEQPRDYWAQLFAEQGYLPRELPGLAGLSEIKPWYQAARLFERQAP